MTQPATERAPTEPSVGRASSVMALGTIASRATGFLRTVALATVLGLGLVNSAYQAANTLPNMVYELLLGGILTSVFVPLITRARAEDPDGGEAYTQRLLSLTLVLLAVATVVAVLIAPALVFLQAFNGSDPEAQRLAVLLARLLLPEIFFYGVAAAAQAVLNTRNSFAAPMWAPVLNNLVVLVTCAVFVALPGPVTLTPATITLPQVLVLGIGTTLGIVLQAAVLVPALRRVGFRFRFRFDVRNARLREAGHLAGWMVAYVAVSQVGVIVVQRLAVLTEKAHPEVPGLATYANALLLFMLPHGIVAVSIITALMPRMSRAAMAGRPRQVARDLSFGTRTTAVVLLPVTAAFVVLGPALGTVLYAYGRSSPEEGRAVGLVLAWGAAGLLFFAISQMQIFAFYALRDTRTPALINVAVVAAKVGVDVALFYALAPEHLVAGLMWGNTVSYAVGVAASGLLLARRLGGLDTVRTVRTLVRLAVASALGGLLAWAVDLAVTGTLGAGPAPSLLTLVGGAALGGALFVLAALRMRVAEVHDVVDTVRARLGR